MLSMLFVGLSIPHFGVILSLVGGTTVTASNFVFPPLFYLLLARQKSAQDGYGDPPQSCYREKVITAVADAVGSDSHRSARNSGSETSQSTSENFPILSKWIVEPIPLHIKVLLIEIIFIGVVGGAASTYSVIASLVDGSSGFTVPCYVSWGTADVHH